MRKFLVVLDDSKECLNAMRFAAMRAAKTGGGVEVLSIIPPEEFNHWIGVGDLMRAEAKERIEVHFEVFAKFENRSFFCDQFILQHRCKTVLKQQSIDFSVHNSDTLNPWPPI